jgi:mannose-1-phosphate guanylyltransferase
MSYRPGGNHRWGVILAGGDGVRLRSLTRFISGDDRPKQFCPLVGGQTLLSQTRVRIAPTISADRTLFLLTRSHESFYSNQLSDVPPDQMIVQPENRGTLPAILCALLRISRIDPDATIAFFPSDHHYTAEGRLMASVEEAFDIVGERDSLILFGATARHAEVAYGWIEPEPESAHPCVKPVRRFWEKPSIEEAQKLLQDGCLWNTFVMIGSARMFLSMIRDAVPEVYEAVAQLPLDGSHTLCCRTNASRFEQLPTSDFSRQVLAQHTERLSVLSLGDVGWSDLGDPQRVVSTLSQHGIESSWIAPWRAMAASAG